MLEVEAGSTNTVGHASADIPDIASSGVATNENDKTLLCFREQALRSELTVMAPPDLLETCHQSRWHAPPERCCLLGCWHLLRLAAFAVFQYTAACCNALLTRLGGLSQCVPLLRKWFCLITQSNELVYRPSHQCPGLHFRAVFAKFHADDVRIALTSGVASSSCDVRNTCGRRRHLPPPLHCRDKNRSPESTPPWHPLSRQCSSAAR